MAQTISTNLLDSIGSYITPDVIDKASSFLHESPTSTGMALSGIIPALLGSVANMASTPGGASQLSNLLASGGHDGSMLSSFSSLVSGGSATNSLIHQGEGLLNTLLGGKMTSIASSIAGFSGMGKSSAVSLMAMAAPLVMGALGKLKSTQGLNPTQLAGLLSSQKSTIASAMPAGLTTSITNPEVEGLRSVTVAPVPVKAPATGRRWWPLLLLLFALLGLIGYLLRGKPNVRTAAITEPLRQAAVTEPVKLCSGNTLGLMAGSFNYNLAHYLVEGSNTELPKTFVFDNLNFDSATTNLTAPSRQTVNDLITILKECPDAQVQLAGNTDNTGDPSANQALSASRADAIKDMLVAGGISPDRMTTAGYGQDRPIATNDTEEGKARNRRTELVVLKR